MGLSLYRCTQNELCGCPDSLTNQMETERVIVETGTDQPGVATATAMFGVSCISYMG